MTAFLTAILALAGTILVYAAARWLYSRVRFALLNPALVAIAVVIVALVALGIPYAEYNRGGHFLTLLLGPAVVALGIPLAQQLPDVRRNARAIGVGLAAGSVVGIAVAVVVALLFRAPDAVVRSMPPRSATTPIAMAITARLGGIPALSAAISIVTGAIGGAIGPELLRFCRVRSRLATGLALGAAAHGLGTARAVEHGDVEGAVGGMAMGLNGIATALLSSPILALLLRLFGR